MPAVGDAMAFFWVVVMRGGMKALVVDETSKIALAFGEAMPMPTLPAVSMRILSMFAVVIANGTPGIVAIVAKASAEDMESAFPPGDVAEMFAC